jgi:hypothetical protein
MRALKIILVLLFFGVAPTAYFALAQSSGVLPGGRLCSDMCLEPTPVSTSTPSGPPVVPPTPTPTPGRNYNSEFCVADATSGAVLQDRCGSYWGPTVTQGTIGSGGVFYFCTCNTRR